VLAHAAALAHRHQAHIEVIHCRARAEDLMPYGVPIPEILRKEIVNQTYQVADQKEEGLRAEVTALAERLDLDASGKRIGEVATVSFVVEAGRQVDVIKRRGRLADMIAVAKPDRDRNLGENTLKAALFNSGRPVMMCPPAQTPPKVVGAKVSIAWNGSAEAARAMSQCKAILRGADKIWILTNGTDAGPGTTAAELVDYLSYHGLEATIECFSNGRKVGTELLNASRGLGADLMIMGAYSESHERETIFGGNTQTIVDTATFPVLLNY
jgi:nucleotide-binding universal stress UspA family protein